VFEIRKAAVVNYDEVMGFEVKSGDDEENEEEDEENGNFKDF
jgi:hypothetical protein